MVVTVSAPFGPAEAFAAGELSSLRLLGHHVTVAPVRPRGGVVHREFAAAADSVIAHALFSPVVFAGALAETIRAPSKVGRVVLVLARSRSFRVLVKNLVIVPKAMWIARSARQRGIEHIHAYWASTPATVGMLAAAVAGISFSFTAHAADIDEDNLIRVKSERATAVRVISKDGWRRLEDASVQAHMLRLVHLGVPVPATPAPRPNRAASLTVLVPGALLPMKGQIDLVRSLRLLRQTHPMLKVTLLLAGAGPMKVMLRREAEKLGVGDKVMFLGHLAHDALLARYRAGTVDVVALSSVATGGNPAEGIPVSLIEAMAHGIPVIGTNSGGTGELIDGTTGILVPMSDPGALAAALARLALNPRLRARLALAGRERVLAEFDVQETSRQLAAAMGSPGHRGASAG